MNLPDTQNANFQYAFKKGYRTAQEGKTLSHMPSSIRHDGEMRDYFQQGWNQFQEELALAEEDKESPWKNRLIWLFMSIIAGIGTAKLIIDDIQTKNQQLAEQTSAPSAQINPNQTTAERPSQPTKAHPIIEARASISPEKPNLKTASPQPNSIGLANDNSLSLLNPSARRDLRLNQAEAKAQAHSAHESTEMPIIHSKSVQIVQAILAKNIQNKQPIGIFVKNTTVPKYVRKVYFYTQIKTKKLTTIYHRWIYQHQIMATIPLKIKAQNYRTWSSKRLSSAWQGQWQIEVLNHNHKVIFRRTFNYIEK